PISSVPWSIVTPPEKLLLAVRYSVPGPLSVSEPLPVAPTPPPFEPVSSAMTSEITVVFPAAGANTRFWLPCRKMPEPKAEPLFRTAPRPLVTEPPEIEPPLIDRVAPSCTNMAPPAASPPPPPSSEPLPPPKPPSQFNELFRATPPLPPPQPKPP